MIFDQETINENKQKRHNHERGKKISTAIQLSTMIKSHKNHAKFKKKKIECRMT